MGFDPRAVLAVDFPDLAVAAIEELGEGWDHVAYLVNDEIVFRLPWAIVEGPGTDEPDPSAAAEVALLRELRGQLPVQIPDPVFVAPGERYFGYPFLPGRPLDSVVAETRDLDSDLVDAVVHVATGVEELVPSARAEALGLPRYELLPNDLATAHDALEGNLLTPRMARVAELALAMLEDSWRAAAARRMVAMHADFGLDHWLVDDDGEIYALIDWTDACVAPAENHVSALMWHVPHLVADAAAAYEQATRAALDRGLVFANGYANALGDVAELAEEDPDGNADEIEWCLHFLRTWSDPDVMSTLGVSDR